MPEFSIEMIANYVNSPKVYVQYTLPRCYDQYLSLGIQQIQHLVENGSSVFLGCHVTATVTAHHQLHQAMIALAAIQKNIFTS